MNKKSFDALEQLIHVPVFLAAILILMLKLVLPAEVALEHVYQPSYLPFALNTIFITAISFWIAWQAVRGYLATGFVPFLILGCALLAAGSTAIIAGYLFDLPDGFNHAGAVYNLGFLLSALLHFINACLLGGNEERIETAEGTRQLVSSLAYPAVFLAVGAIWAADDHALLPRFFNPGSGPTIIREVVQTANVLLLGIASYLLLRLARQRKVGYLQWYGFGLALIAVGFVGSAFGVPGSPMSWAGRASRYLGNIYLLAAAVYAYREALHAGLGWEEAAQEFFRESEGRYRTLVQSARSSIISVDRHQRIFLWNPSAEKLFGYTSNEVMGQGLTGLIALPDSRETLEGIIRRSPHGVHELMLRRKDGGEFAAEFTVYGLTGRDEKSLNIRDITERKKAEEELRKAKDELEERVKERTYELYEESLYARSLIEASLDPQVTIGFDGKITDVNRASEELTGISRKQLIGSDFSDCFTDPKRARAGYEFVLQQGTVRDYELGLKHRDGHVTPVLYNATVYRDESGKVLGVFAAARDITQLRRTQKALEEANETLERRVAEQTSALRENEVLLRHDLEAMTRLQKLGTLYAQEGNLESVLSEIVETAIAVSGADFGNIQMVDPETSTLRIMTQRGFPDWWLDFWNQVPEGKGVCGTALKARERVIVEDIEHSPVFAGTPALEIQLRAGVRAVQSTPLVSRSGRLLGMLSTHYERPHRPDDRSRRLLDLLARHAADIIEQVQSETALREANDSLEQRVRERTTDLLNLADQLEKSRGDLRQLASELVLSEERERKRIATVMHDEICQTLAVAKMRVDMLQGALADEGSRKTLGEAREFLMQSIQEARALMNEVGNPLLFDMGVSAACTSLAERLMASNPIQIDCDIQDDFNDLDPDMKVVLYQLIRELLNNVVKHSNGHHARVSIRSDNGLIHAEVRDDGAGFDPQTLGSPTAEGGFGLFSIQERLKAFHATMQIESAPGKGTVVKAAIPLGLERSSEPGPRRPPS